MRRAEVLVVEECQWLLGMDAQSVHSVKHGRGGHRLARLFGSATDESSPTPRTFAVKGTEHRFEVARVRGTRWFDASELHPLSPTLRSLGAPPWLKGHAWGDADELILLIDPIAMARAYSSTP